MFDGCTIVPGIATAVPAVEHQNATITSFAICNDDARVPLVIDFELFFTRTTTGQYAWLNVRRQLKYRAAKLRETS